MDVPLERTYAVIMAGGSGTRFWPASRGARPKQLLRITGDETTMLQATVARLQPLLPPERMLVVTTAALAEETRRQLPALPPAQIIAEPVGRDTAPCVCLASLIVERLAPDGTMILLPADHAIRPADTFQRALAAGVRAAQDGSLVTYGIVPRGPATGYGYIELAGDLGVDDGLPRHRAARFVEKPDLETARAYLAAGNYRWNSGIFTWRVDVVLAELQRHCPRLRAGLEGVSAAWGADGFAAELERAYPGLEKISIDYALLEKAGRITVVTPDFEWDDLGSWDALYDYREKSPDGLVCLGEVLAEDCRDSLIFAEDGRYVAAVGLRDQIVVAAADAVLVCTRNRSQEVKRIVARLREEGREGLL